MQTEHTFRKLFKRVEEFQQRKFPHQTFDSKAKHLGREVEEWRNQPGDLMECVDVLLLHIGCAVKQGFTVEQVLTAAHQKCDINNLRKWGAADADGVHHHIEADAPREEYDGGLGRMVRVV